MRIQAAWLLRRYRGVYKLELDAIGPLEGVDHLANPRVFGVVGLEELKQSRYSSEDVRETTAWSASH